MKIQFCHRCRREVPMFDEEEYHHFRQLLFNDRPATVREYEKLTGIAETNSAAILKAILQHRLADFGPPCVECGVLLRTPKATFCAACGKTQNKRCDTPTQ